MALPRPAPGKVIRYSSISWSEEHARVREEGSKDRPCVIVIAVDKTVEGLELVTVVPITHSPPPDLSLVLEVPKLTKARLGLDDARSWIVVSEANQFYWPGPDLRPVPGSKTRKMIYGLLPQTLFELVRTRLADGIRAKRITIVPRTE